MKIYDLSYENIVHYYFRPCVMYSQYKAIALIEVQSGNARKESSIDGS